MLTIVVSVIVGGSTAALAKDGLDVSSDNVYEVMAATGIVHVESTYTITNTKVSTQSGSTITDYYFFAYTTAVPRSAVNVTAISNGETLQVELSAIDNVQDFQRTKVNFANLYNGQTRTVLLAYDIAGEVPRTPDNEERVNAAYASFYAVGEGDEGKVSVSVVVPTGLDVELLGAQPTVATTADGKRVYRQENIVDPLKWYVLVSARNDSALVRIPIDTAGVSVSVRSWPGDTAWAEFATKDVRDGLPALKSLVDEPLPQSGLEVIEATTPYLYGAGGWYTPKTNVIEAGEELNDHVILHELAHSWFNHNYFEDRWMSEGLAEAYSARAQTVIGQKPQPPEPVDREGAGSQALTMWGLPAGRKTTDDQAREKYGYNTAYYVFDELAKEVGTPKLAAVYDAILLDHSAYQPANTTATTTDRTDWKRLLDLLQEAGGSTKAEDLFKTYVLTGPEAEGLPERAAARAAYNEFRASIEPWSAPALVPALMSKWKFADATAFMARAKESIARRDALMSEAAANGLTVKADLQSLFENATADWSFDAFDRVVQEQLDAIHHLAATKPIVDAPRNFNQRVGLRGQHPEADLADARTAFNNGNLTDANAKADVVTALVAGSEKAGRKTVRRWVTQAAVALLAFIILLAVLIRSIHKRRRRRRARTTIENHEAIWIAPPTGTTSLTAPPLASPPPTATWPNPTWPAPGDPPGR